MKKWICILLVLQFTFVTPVVAQQDDFIKNTQEDILLVGGAGAGGAILGLSTLSFYDTPSKHISNIWTGAAIGIIAGVIFVAYNSAQKGSEELMSQRSSPSFGTSARVSWHAENTTILTPSKVPFGSTFWKTSF
jgi:hypothetical protein